MDGLLELLQDSRRSDVYRAGRRDAIAEAARGSALDVVTVQVPARPDKASLLAAIAAALAFPSWFGANWDALEDCLTDLSWRNSAGTVMVFEGGSALPRDDLRLLIEVLSGAAEFWKERRKPFFAVFIDSERRLALADLPGET